MFFVKIDSIVHYVWSFEKGKREGVKKGGREKKGVGKKCGAKWWCVTNLLASCFSITTTPIHHSLSFVFLCLFSCPFPFPVSLSVLGGCGVWFVPRVCHTPPTHSLCLVLAAPPFLPLASTSLSVLSFPLLLVVVLCGCCCL